MVNSGNKNESSEIVIDSKHYIKKRYSDIQRFFCELKYLNYFKDKDINVPSIYKFDKIQKTVIVDKIDGKINDSLNSKEIKLCIDILAKIVLIFGLEKKNSNEIDIYISKVRSNIIWWCKNHNYTVEEMQLNILLQKLRTVCYISLFKDAKPSNWIFQKDKIYAIDFDYVKKSFFLADLAQLLSYISLRRRINYIFFVNYYLKQIFPKMRDYAKFYISFKLAVLNSNIASEFHRENLPAYVKRGFDKQIKAILNEFKII